MKKLILIVLLPLVILAALSSVSYASTITVCEFDEDVYNPGQTGQITVTIYNGEDEKIRVTELYASLDYYFADGTVYMQTFFTSTELPVEIERGQTLNLPIPISLPTNIAPGYTSTFVKAIPELWHNQSEQWTWTEHPTYTQTLYIESPYKGQYEEQQSINDDLDLKYQELQAVNSTSTNLMYLLGITTLVFAVVTAFLILINRRSRPIAQPRI